MEEGFRGVLQANKREMFDGMRAYHESEIKHTNHAITILLSIAGAANAGLVAILSKTMPMESSGTIALGIFAIVTIFSIAIAGTTHLKINGDNHAYRRFGHEYYRTCKVLQLMDSIAANEATIVVKPDLPVGQGKGYRRTQHIVWAFALLTSLVTWGFAAVVILSAR